MKFKILNPKQSLNKAYQKVTISRPEYDFFKTNLSKLLSNIDHEESEENVKNHLKDFLNETYYKGKHLLNTKNKTDLVIYLDNKQNSKAGVLLEVKRPANKSGMISREDLNRDAIHELMLYYLQERIEQKNDEIRYLITTNIYEWFIFDAVLFENLFYKNSGFVKNYNKWKNDQKVSSNTSHFYNEIARPLLEKLDSDITFTYFDLNDYKKLLNKTDKQSENKFIPLYKILSPVHLLKQPFANDSNSLNRNFYNELLHIIGLEEVKVKNKKLIDRKDVGERDPGSLIENAIQILKTDNALDRIKEPEKYGSEPEEQLYHIALELSLTWINRVLFLKLLESQLFNYHKSDDYKFLNIKTINDFDELYKLFHSVLAVKLSERTKEIKEKYVKVPYLNSSLFEISDLENQAIRINLLDNGAAIKIYKYTVFKNKSEKRQSGELSALQYLFQFLDAYNFTSEGKEEIEEEKKTLINASVLGLIFEKINGYKDGSYFTPGFITMYMCRETIRRAVVQKFNEKYKWNCETFDDLKNHIAVKRNTKDILEANEVINSLKICDPAVGSGHFLVSALNEIITIKSELGILADEKGVLLGGYDVKIENDELIVTLNNGEDIFDYHPPQKGKSNETQRVQETLFREKQSIIENCLFGVDINPNSVSIARLRLWIELLKNAYYTKESGYTELETLPNIDINIKEGNSLVSRFEIKQDIFSESDKKILDIYKINVNLYKNEHNREKRRELKKSIETTKERIKGFAVDPLKKEREQIEKLTEALHKLNTESLFDKDRSKAEQEKVEKKRNDLTAKLNKLAEQKDKKAAEYRTLYANAFEWRFEFPEVLDDDGNFVGFDVVIGNPPYGLELSDSENRFYKQKFLTNLGELEVYTFFIELGLEVLTNTKGMLSMITSNTWYYLEKYSILREKILLNYFISTLVELEKRVFADAPDVVPAVFNFCKFITNHKTKLYKSQKVKRVYDLTNFNDFNKNVVEQKIFLSSPNYTFNTKNNVEVHKLLKKLSSNLPLNNFYKVIYGIKTGDNKSNLTKTVKKTGNWKKCVSSANNISRYVVNWKGDYLNVGPHLVGLNNVNYEQEKILIQYIRKLSMPIRLVCAIDMTGEFYPLNNFSFIIDENNESLFYLLGILNSKLMNWYFANTFIDYNIKPKYIEKLPIKIPDAKNKNKFVKIITQITSIKKQNSNSDTSKLESEIDQMVYKLYELTEEEIKVVEGSSS